jgi:hypothetical protein
MDPDILTRSSTNNRLDDSDEIEVDYSDEPIQIDYSLSYSALNLDDQALSEPETGSEPLGFDFEAYR